VIKVIWDQGKLKGLRSENMEMVAEGTTDWPIGRLADWSIVSDCFLILFLILIGRLPSFLFLNWLIGRFLFFNLNW